MNLSNLLGSVRKKTLTRAALRPGRQRPRLHVENLEARDVPATLPAPQVDQTSFRSIDGDGSALITAANPTNPNEIFGAYVTHVNDIVANATRIQYKWSSNGGTTWSTIAFNPLTDENDQDPYFPNTFHPFEQVSDPSIAWDRFGKVFVTYTEFHPDNTAGVVMLRKFDFVGSPVEELGGASPFPQRLYGWFHSTEAANPNVAVDTNLGSFQDPLVSGAAGLQTDPLAAAQTTKDQVRVFASWNTLVTDDNDAAAGANPNVIVMRMSSDGGATFTGPMLINSDEYTANSGSVYTYPKTVFTPGRAGEPGSGGRMVTVFTSNTGGPGNSPTLKTDTQTFGATTLPKELSLPSPSDNGAYTVAFGQPPVQIRPASGQTLSPTNALGIDDAIAGTNGAPDTAVMTEFDYTVSAAQAATLGTLSDVSIALDIVGDNLELGQYSARLIAPNGAFIDLFFNRITESGGNRATSVGLSGKPLGGPVGGSDTTFTDSAFYPINTDAGAATPNQAPYPGAWLPEGTNPGDNPFHNTFGGMTAAQMAGKWKLEITDHKNSNTGVLTGATLNLVSGMSNGVGLDRGTGATTVANNPLGTNHPTKPSYAPTSGVGANISVAVDNTLGAFSPYENRVYLAYSNGSSISMLYSDGLDATGGSLWNTQPIAAGAGFLPELAVDPSTGTLDLAYYTTRYDASATRTAVVLQTAVDMPDFKDRTQSTNLFELSPATFINPNEQAYDQITSATINTEPITSNDTVASDARMWGNNFGLTVFDGRVDIEYSGNLDLAGTQIRTQDIEQTAGPRVVGGDMGPILGTASVTPLVWQNHTGTLGNANFVPGHTVPGASISYNQPVGGGDGRNSFSAFVVTFDRPIATVSPTSTVSTFTTNDIKVIFHGPTDNPDGAGTTIPVASVQPLDDIRDPLDDSIYGSERFLVRLTNPQTAVGTYSYLIGSHQVNVAALTQDRVRGPIVNTANSGAPQTFTHTGAPDQILDFTGTPAPLTTSVTVPNGAFPAGVVVGTVSVKVNITHTADSDLQFQLVSPAGQVITLLNQGDAFGANFTNTVFADAGGPLANGTAPYTGTFKPAQRLGQLFAASPAGQWQLIVTDLAAGDSGTLNNWSLVIQGVTQTFSTSNGNFIDQNANGAANEVPFTDVNGLFNAPDGFAMPNPTNSQIPFRLPYVTGSFPIEIPGPRLVSTTVPGQVSTSTDNLVLSKSVSAINLTFDRTIDATTFTPADVLRMTGVSSAQFPTGDIPLSGITVTPIDSLGNKLTAGTNSKFFQVSGFPAVSLSGSYTIQLSSQIADTQGNLLDTNTNAGIGDLLGTVTNADVVTKTYGGDVPGPNGTGLSIPAKGTLTVPLTVDDAYLLKKAALNITVSFPAGNYRDLTGTLVAPDGTSVLLFAQAPTSGPGDMTNVTLTDDPFFQDPVSNQPRPITPIQNGFQANGFFNPEQPFQPLINHSSDGVWKLVIKNAGTQTSGVVSKFKLLLDQPVIPSGLGESIADRFSASFRIANVDGSQDITKDNWSPVGPAPQIDVNGVNSTAGRVASLAVDPSDPSGNTVFAAGASGGVWRTNNFLTRDPDGPNWVPLADFGPNNAINVGSLALYNSNSDPNTNLNPDKTVVLVGTGSSALDVIDAEDQRTFDGVGFLLSEDAGKTWQVLDSTNNWDPDTQSYRPLVDAGATWSVTSASEAGNTVTLVTSSPHDILVGSTITVAGVSVAGYNGTGFTVTAVSPTTVSYTDSTGGLANASGGTVHATDRRDHLFVGAVVNKVLFEQNPDAFSNRPIVWAAVGQGSDPNPNVAGLWRSEDGGRTWTQIFQGEASDFVFAPGSQLPNSGNRPTIGYLAIQGTAQGGVYFSQDLDAPMPGFTLMTGGVGRPTINTGSIPVGAPQNTPNGDFGKITLATPAYVPGSPLANNYYQNWLYAAVANKDGTFQGLYMTKDNGANWTQVQLTPSAGFSDQEPNGQVDVTINPNAPGGNHSLALAVDPNNPNIVYFGSDTLLRIDTTLLNDPYNLTMYSYDEDASAVRYATEESAVAADLTGTIRVGGGLDSINPATLLDSQTPSTNALQGALDGDPRKVWNHLNLVRDPYQQFVTDTALTVENVASLTNNGFGATWVEQYTGPQDYNWVSQIVPMLDPLTGQARLMVQSDEGIVSYVSNQDGSFQQVNGINQDYQVPDVNADQTDLQITGYRNGNLQVARLYSGDSQPSLLAANISGSLLFGAARRLGDVQASGADPTTGAITWDDFPFDFAAEQGRADPANYVATDSTGTGNTYILRRINDMPPILDNPVNFFQISKNGGAPVSFTNGLFESNADAQGLGQWTNAVKFFAVNPVDPNGIMIGSATGQLFLTRDMGLNWHKAALASSLDGSMATALAFGAPLPNAIDLNQYLYFGSQDGNVYVSTTGGGNLPTSWVKITGGAFGSLDGSPIEKIIPSPTRGSNELFVVTRNGVYHMANWDQRDPTNPNVRMPTPWEDITGNIKQITMQAFGHNDWVVPVLAATNPITTMAVDWRPTNSPSPGAPVLYVGGDGGVFQAVYDGAKTTWIRYTGTGQGAASDGGGLPVVKVTDLDLALGDIDPSSGRPKPSGSPDALVATTLGRGTWDIAIGVPPGVSGPRVIASTPTTIQATALSSVTVTFNEFITASTFDASDVVITTPSGQTVAATSILDVTPAGQTPSTVWKISFPAQQADGIYTIKVGPHIASGTTEMNQNGNTVNGEPGDAFTMQVVVGRNDVVDYVNDTLFDLLGRFPTTAEYLGQKPTATNPQPFGKTIPNLVAARTTALQTEIKEILGTYNNFEARDQLVQRLFDGAGANEIGNLLPASTGYVLSNAERDTLVSNLKNGKMSPESIVVYILSKSEYYNSTGSPATPATFLNKLYTDLFKGTNITFNKLPTATQQSQLTEASTPSGRVKLVKSLVGGATVKWDDDGNPTTPLKSTDYRLNLVNLLYKQLLGAGRIVTPAELTAGKALMAKPLAVNSLQGSEWVLWKVMTGTEYFGLKTQADGLPDDGLHTDRSWIEGVILDRFHRVASQANDVDPLSQKILDVAAFKNARAAFVKAVVNSSEYRKIQITADYNKVLGRGPSATETSSWLTKLANGSTFTGLVSNLLGSTEYYTKHTVATDPTAAQKKEWADAVYQTLLGRAPTATEESTLIAKIASQGRAGASLSVLNSTDTTNGPTWRDMVITAAFNLALGRGPSAAELTAYETFLKTNKWEFLFVDILANGAAIIESPTLPRQFWEIDD